MKEMEQKLEAIGSAIKENLNDENKLKDNTKKLLEEIDRVFAIFQYNLKLRKESLKKSLSDQSETDGTAIKERLEKLQKHQQKIKSSIHRFSEFLVDDKLEPSKRETKIQDLCNEALNGVGNVLNERSTPIKFSLEIDEVNRVSFLFSAIKCPCTCFFILNSTVYQ